DAAGAADERHPDFGFDLLGRGFGVGVVDVGAFDAVANGELGAGPLSQARDAVGDEPQFAGDVAMLVAGGVNVERSDVAALHVLGVILRMIASHAAADILIPGHALTEIQEDGARAIGLLAFLVVLADFARQDGR